MDIETGTLYIVSTPIGNLDDITYRAIQVLRDCDLVAAEDTRRTRGMLTHFDIAKPLTSYNSHNEGYKGETLLKKIIEGKSVALVTDAGTPGISDPACSLIRSALENEIKIVPIPGVTAAITALSVSGLPTDRFFFEGFLPRKKGKREKLIRLWEQFDRTIVLYESPHRTVKTLNEIHAILGDRPAVVGREMTKVFEEMIRGRLSELIVILEGKKIKGEVTIVIGPEEKAPIEEKKPDLYPDVPVPWLR